MGRDGRAPLDHGAARPPLRHAWWHHVAGDLFYAVATEHGRIVSAWMQVGAHEWVALDDDFEPLRLADERGEIHRNEHPDGFTDELTSSLGPVQ